MELFSEIYGCYYHVVAQILRRAHGGGGIGSGEISRIISKNAFSESGLHLLPKLLKGEWDLLAEEGERHCSKLEHANTSLPLTNLQKSWLKALLRDPRIRLFLDEEQLDRMQKYLANITPLFEHSDFHIFDAAADGDEYSDEAYIQHFRMILSAIKQKKPLLAQYESGKGGRVAVHFLAQKLLYSQKDDKFRAVGLRLTGSRSKPVLLNLARIKDLAQSDQSAPQQLPPCANSESKRTVRIAISDERNALERCMLQFASYDKQTVFDEASGRYFCDISYDPLEEAEVLIRILSFGPVIKVLGPAHFLEQIRSRVRGQMERMQ